MELLLKAIQELKEEGCMQQALYDQLVNRKVKIDFGMYSNPNENSGAANYDPRDRSIKFKNNSTITKENLKEELFHAWQDAYYEGGIYQYRETGKVNIEFEAKLFTDIIGGKDELCCMAFRGKHIPLEIFNSYYDWIESIRFKPDRSFNDSDYIKWLNLFNLYDMEYGSSTSDDLQRPLSLS